MKIENKTLLNIEAACDATVAAKTISDDKPALVGVLYGNAVDFVQRANPAGGAAFKGFAGAFRIDPLLSTTDGGNDVITTSSVLFLPAQPAALVRERLTAIIYPHADKPEKKARGAVEFVALLYIAANGAWGIDWFIAPRPIDPLAALVGEYTREAGKAGAASEPAKSDDKPAKAAKAK
jgi:hypothetical protein